LESAEKLGRSEDFNARRKGADLYRVRDTAQTILAPNGLFHRERPLLTAAQRWLDGYEATLPSDAHRFGVR
jgi:hypothetical protein